MSHIKSPARSRRRLANIRGLFHGEYLFSCVDEFNHNGWPSVESKHASVASTIAHALLLIGGYQGR